MYSNKHDKAERANEDIYDDFKLKKTFDLRGLFNVISIAYRLMLARRLRHRSTFIQTGSECGVW